MTVISHTMLDDGLDFCVPCDTLVRSGRFCGQCGQTLLGRGGAAAGRQVRRCAVGPCGHETRSTFCEACGSRVVPHAIEELERGTITMVEMVRRTKARYEAWQRAHPEPARQPAADHERERLYGAFRDPPKT